jgi:hypothetical protein
MTRGYLKRSLPLLLLLLAAACAPGPQKPTALEPIAPLSEPEPAPEEPSVTLAPAEPATDEPAPNETATGVPTAETPVETTELPEAPAGGEAPADPAAEGEATEEGAAPSSAPQGTIGISADNQGFVSSSADELNPVTVTAGGTFYLQLTFSDPDGITEAQVQLRNSPDEGTLPTGPFSIAASDCDAQLASAPTELTCTLTVSVAPDAQNISEPGETAYAFRPFVTDALGNSMLAFSWAYLIVEPQ